MIDLSRISYRVMIIDEKGKQYNIKDYVENLGWEENEKEISMRLSFTARNDKTSQGYLSSIIKPGCMVGISASDGNIEDEVSRGYVESWNPSEKNSGKDLKCTCYDELYKLQKSQDNQYVASGTGTKAALKKIFKKWKIPIGTYKGPNAKHGKLTFKNRYLSDIILEILDDARKKGKGKYIPRASKGKVDIIPRGSNEDVYVFQADNTISMSQLIDTSSLITRVKIIGKSKKSKKQKVEATVNGLTEYGIRQRIYNRGSDESLKAAKSAGKEILNNEGRITEELTLQSPDVPFIRKGDLVYVIAEGEKDYYYVKSIQHSADTFSMTMTLEKKDKNEVTGKNKKKKKKNHSVGDVVTFKGGKHYVSSLKGSKGFSAKAGKAKIKKYNKGSAHPWMLIHTDSKSNVYGWVDDGSFD